MHAGSQLQLKEAEMPKQHPLWEAGDVLQLPSAALDHVAALGKAEGSLQ